MDDYTEVRNILLALLGESSALMGIDPLCADSVEMLESAKETGKLMHSKVLTALRLMPKKG